MFMEVLRGEYIVRTVERMVALAKGANSAVEADFNGIRLVATPVSSVGDLRRYYDDECTRQAVAWRNSP